MVKPNTENPTKTLSLTSVIRTDHFPTPLEMTRDDYEQIQPIFESHYYTLLAILRYLDSRLTRAAGVDQANGDKNMTEWNRWANIYDRYLRGLGLSKGSVREIQNMDNWRQLFGYYKRSGNLKNFMEASTLVNRLGLAISTGFDQIPPSVKFDDIISSLKRGIGTLEQKIRQKPEPPTPEQTAKAFETLLEQWRKEYAKLVHGADV